MNEILLNPNHIHTKRATACFFLLLFLCGFFLHFTPFSVALWEIHGESAQNLHVTHRKICVVDFVAYFSATRDSWENILMAAFHTPVWFSAIIGAHIGSWFSRIGRDLFIFLLHFNSPHLFPAIIHPDPSYLFYGSCRHIKHLYPYWIYVMSRHGICSV